MANEPTRKVMSISPRMLSMNLDTSVNGKRDSLYMSPREVVEVTESQFRSVELQKLLGAKFIVDVSTAKRL